MPVYSYIKEKNQMRRNATTALSYVTLTAGSLLMFWAFYPVVSFEIYSRFFIQKDFIAPVPQAQASSPAVMADSVLGNYNIFSNNLRDFTQASLWFPTSQTPATAEKKVTLTHYNLSIPKLNIDNATVTVGGDDLAKSLVHYIPTSDPGVNGNVVIFGHSTLPQLYNPKDYKTIFTYLPSLEKGDKIIVKAGGLNYEYEVFEMFVVKPDQISVLAQRYDAPYLTLITCVPPGTFWNRLVVRAKLTSLPTEL